jgi:uncharacterized membrane protein YgcG
MRILRRGWFAAAITTAAVLIGGVVLVGGGAAAAFATQPALQPSARESEGSAPVAAVPAGPNDFTFASFDAQYFLDRDDAGRSTLRVIETLVAQFPETDQNRGIQRVIPIDYDGHPTDLTIESVTDQDGAPRAFSTERTDGGSDDNEFLTLTIADDGVYVHGTQSYVIGYTQNNITKAFADTGSDEFYRDLNGTAWKQPFGRVSAELHLPAGLSAALTGSNACYWGAYGAKNPCDVVSVSGTNADSILSVAVPHLAVGENVSMAVGFIEGTFVPRNDSFFLSAFAPLQIVAAVLALAAAVAAIVHRVTVLRSGRGRPTIVPEYTPPRFANLYGSAVVSKTTSKVIAAGLVNLAVRHAAQIIEHPGGGFMGPKVKYELRFLTESGLDAQEVEFSRALFGGTPAPGKTVSVTPPSSSTAKRITAFVSTLTTTAQKEGLTSAAGRGRSVVIGLLALVFTAATFFFGFAVIAQSYGGPVPLILMAVAIVAVIATAIAVVVTPLTAAGAELRDYIKGVRMYIELAEADRFRMLQSPDGALKTTDTGVPAATVPQAGAQPNGMQQSAGLPPAGEVVKLYEKLLPYAILLGLEKQWSAVLGRFYESTNSEPSWYGGSSAFNAAAFAVGLSTFSGSATNSFQAGSSGSSSSFGGSTGGGFSGGGSGGGGGGGV